MVESGHEIVSVDDAPAVSMADIEAVPAEFDPLTVRKTLKRTVTAPRPHGIVGRGPTGRVSRSFDTTSPPRTAPRTTILMS